MKDFTPEMIKKAKAAKNADELLVLAKENGMELTAEEAKAYFEQLNAQSGELSDDELDSVSGGGCHAKDGRLVVTTRHECEHWVCICGNKQTNLTNVGYNYFNVCSNTGCGKRKCCENCKHMSYEGGLWLCNNSANNK